MNTQAEPDRNTPIRIALFAVLMMVGLGYVLSLAWFFRHSSNFVERLGIEAATDAVADRPATLPMAFTFDAKSPWTQSLAYGWNRPEEWGVWADNSTAAVVLPPVSGSSSATACIGVRFGNIPQRRRWHLAITVDGRPWGEVTSYWGEGPFEIRNMAPIEVGQPIVIRFFGPAPVIPRAITHDNPDSRLLSFSLLGMTIAKKC